MNQGERIFILARIEEINRKAHHRGREFCGSEKHGEWLLNGVLKAIRDMRLKIVKRGKP